MKVSVELSDTEIVSVKVVEHKETQGISDAAIDKIPKEIVEGQTLNVDVAAGASVTSKAILDAVEDCIKQAGGDVGSLKTTAK
ncbi:electron transport complex subunit RsxG [Oxobacter pfennigii]|uniref:Electron transport complex subunit RsxG n=1 Tax=Oxobacter pfennigii TaxID=36849 RepID=A0A0P8X0T5_9CLOT|nr:FMN-binding protein [Oxobacter pfennigii]KPU44393.1 electron transport complex subunit RsxG [Oxobacter pfennigii]